MNLTTQNQKLSVVLGAAKTTNNMSCVVSFEDTFGDKGSFLTNTNGTNPLDLASGTVRATVTKQKA